MSQHFKIKTSCSGCGGTGNQPLHPSGSTTCFLCNGTGKQTIGTITVDSGFDDVLDKCNDILDKCNDILEAINE